MIFEVKEYKPNRKFSDVEIRLENDMLKFYIKGTDHCIVILAPEKNAKELKELLENLFYSLQ